MRPSKACRGSTRFAPAYRQGRIARVFFVLIGNQMVLLHGFVKKTQKTPDKELKLAIARMKEVQRHG
jgi:phage-related protein